VQASEDIMQGVVSIPHGWGHHREGIRMQIAAQHAGVSANDLTDDQVTDALCGNAALNGVVVTVEKTG
jgi:anaerobic selenocysteine-containing dehydrogenase